MTTTKGYSDSESGSSSSSSTNESSSESEDEVSRRLTDQGEVRTVKSKGQISGAVAGDVKVKAEVGAIVNVGCYTKLKSGRKRSGLEETWCKVKGSRQPNRSDLISLIEKYKHEEGWMYPLPFDLSVRFAPEEYYVELNLDVYSRDGKYKKSEKVNVAQLFNPVINGGASALRVLVRGDPGFGKSTLCQKAAHDWSHEITTFDALPWKSTLLVLFRLRFLRHPPKLEEELLEFLSSFYSTRFGTENLQELLGSLGRNVLLVLDGFDEVNTESQEHVKEFLSWRNTTSLFHSSSVLVTSRPTSDDSFLQLFDKHFIIRNLSKDKVEALVQRFTTSKTPVSALNQTKTEKLLSVLNSYPLTRHIERKLGAHTGSTINLAEMPPLFVAVICWIIRQPGFAFSNKEILYSSVKLLAKRCKERENYHMTDKDIEGVLSRLGILSLSLTQPVVTNEQLSMMFDSDMSFVALIGIMKCHENAMGQLIWEPVHKSFLDALAVRTWDSRTKQSHPKGLPSSIDCRNCKIEEIHIQFLNGIVIHSELCISTDKLDWSLGSKIYFKWITESDSFEISNLRFKAKKASWFITFEIFLQFSFSKINHSCLKRYKQLCEIFKLNTDQVRISLQFSQCNKSLIDDVLYSILDPINIPADSPLKGKYSHEHRNILEVIDGIGNTLPRYNGADANEDVNISVLFDGDRNGLTISANISSLSFLQEDMAYLSLIQIQLKNFYNFGVHVKQMSIKTANAEQLKFACDVVANILFSFDTSSFEVPFTFLSTVHRRICETNNSSYVMHVSLTNGETITHSNTGTPFLWKDVSSVTFTSEAYIQEQKLKIEMLITAAKLFGDTARSILNFF